MHSGRFKNLGLFFNRLELTLVKILDLRVGEMHSGRFKNLGLFFNRLELTLVKILDLKVAVSLAVQLRAVLRIGL